MAIPTQSRLNSGCGSLVSGHATCPGRGARSAPDRLWPRCAWRGGYRCGRSATAGYRNMRTGRSADPPPVPGKPPAYRDRNRCHVYVRFQPLIGTIFRCLLCLHAFVVFSHGAVQLWRLSGSALTPGLVGSVQAVIPCSASRPRGSPGAVVSDNVKPAGLSRCGSGWALAWPTWVASTLARKPAPSR